MTIAGLLFCWLAAGSPLLGSEKKLEIAPDVSAAWLIPEGEWQGATVMLLHGFADDCHGPAQVSKRLAEAIAARGIATLRINFRGEGDTKRTALASTRFTRLEDTAAAHAWLLRQPQTDPDRIGVLGFSLGGATAIESAGTHPAWFASMVLWSSVGGDLYQAMTQGALAETARQAAATGVGEYDIKGWKTVTVKHDFFESLRGVNLQSHLEKYPGAFLSIRGTADYLPALESEFLKRAPGTPREALLIGGADHIFHVFDPALDTSDRAIQATVDWFERTLAKPRAD